MWVSNENLHNTKVVDLEKLCKSGIQHFSIWALQIGDNFRLPRGPWNFRNHIYALISISLSPGLLCSRRPPYAAGGLRPPRARGQMDPGKPLHATWPAPWRPPTPTRVPGRSRAATTPRPAQRRCLLRPLAVDSPRPNRPPPVTPFLTQELFGL